MQQSSDEEPFDIYVYVCVCVSDLMTEGAFVIERKNYAIMDSGVIAAYYSFTVSFYERYRVSFMTPDSRILETNVLLHFDIFVQKKSFFFVQGYCRNMLALTK